MLNGGNSSLERKSREAGNSFVVWACISFVNGWRFKCSCVVFVQVAVAVGWTADERSEDALIVGGEIYGLLEDDDNGLDQRMSLQPSDGDMYNITRRRGDRDGGRRTVVRLSFSFLASASSSSSTRSWSGSSSPSSASGRF